MLAESEVKTAKLRIILLASLLAGSAVSFVGCDWFCCFYIVRRYLGATHRWLIPGSAILGGTIMVLGTRLPARFYHQEKFPSGP